MNSIIETILICSLFFAVFGLIGLFINTFMPGYKSLENRNKSNIRLFFESLIGFFKLFIS